MSGSIDEGLQEAPVGSAASSGSCLVCGQSSEHKLEREDSNPKACKSTRIKRPVSWKKQALCNLFEKVHEEFNYYRPKVALHAEEPEPCSLIQSIFVSVNLCCWESFHYQILDFYRLSRDH